MMLSCAKRQLSPEGLVHRPAGVGRAGSEELAGQTGHSPVRVHGVFQNALLGAPVHRPPVGVLGGAGLPDALDAALDAFRGDISQIPPMYSAIKIGGKKLYELARKGQEVERKPRNITIFELAVEDGSGSDWDLRVRCSKGTYVRTLCHDIGQSLGCGGCMSSLRRTRAGRFTLEQAVTMEQILAFAQEHDPAELLMPVDALFAQHPALIVTLGQTEKLKHGAAIRDWHFADGTYRVYSETGEFLLLGTVKGQILTTVKSFFEV